jgi:dihydroorotase
MIYKRGQVEIWQSGDKYFVFGTSSDPRTAHDKETAMTLAGVPGRRLQTSLS